MDKSRVDPSVFFIEKISFSLKLFSGHFYGQSFIKTVRGPSSNILVAILNLEILLNFILQVLRFTQTKKKTVYNNKFTLLEGPKFYVLNFIFREISPKF